MNNKISFSILLSGFLLLLLSCGNIKRDNSEAQSFLDPIQVDDGSKTSDDGLVKVYTDRSFTWNGPISDGKADGQGIIYWTETNERYEGVVSSGNITGNGSLYRDEDLVYNGEWLDGEYSGSGTLYENGLNFTGFFSNGKKNGDGTLYFANGNRKFEGVFENDISDGFGELYNESGDCIRRGFFYNLRLKEEDGVQQLALDVGRKVVEEMFDGGTNIDISLYSAKYNKDQSEIEIVFDITFNGNIITDNYYSCRIAARNYYPEIEFLYKNSSAENYLGAKTIFTGVLTGIDIYNDLFNNQ